MEMIRVFPKSEGETFGWMEVSYYLGTNRDTHMDMVLFNGIMEAWSWIVNGNGGGYGDS